MKDKIITGVAILAVMKLIDQSNLGILDYAFYIVVIIWAITSIKEWGDRHAKG